MNVQITGKTGAPIREGMIGLFFEDINYAADGGIYVEMIENRSFEFLDCYGTKGDYYTKYDGGFSWKSEEQGKMEFISGSPLREENPHYLRFTAESDGDGFSNGAYDGICMKADMEYHVRFYARTVSYEGDFRVSIEKNGQCFAEAIVESVEEPQEGLHKWNLYETVIKGKKDVRGARFCIRLSGKGIVEFDFISMFPADAVAGLFRRDLFEKLKEMKPGFIRFPGGCIVEGNTLSNRYRFKDTLGAPEGRKHNWNRWAVHDTKEEDGYHNQYSHYNQSLGLGYYEYFLLCELTGAKPLPVQNVGMACQYQSFEKADMGTEEFNQFIQDTLDLIEFANGSAETAFGKIRVQMGHPESFNLEMIGIGNEQWETEEADFFARYEAFEKAIHAKYPEIQLIGSAGPDIVSEKYEQAWEFYKKKIAENDSFVLAVDEHYYVKPEWLYDHTDFYDDYPRECKVFAGEYAAHPLNGMNRPDANTLDAALAEAAFLTGIERNADVVYLASYAPLFARVGYAQWSPDMIWFDDQSCYGTPSYYVQALYAANMGTVTLDLEGQEKELREKGIYMNVSLEEKSGDMIVKAVNRTSQEQTLCINSPDTFKLSEKMQKTVLSGDDRNAYNSIEEPEGIIPVQTEEIFGGSIRFPAESFTIIRIAVKKS